MVQRAIFLFLKNGQSTHLEQKTHESTKEIFQSRRIYTKQIMKLAGAASSAFTEPLRINKICTQSLLEQQTAHGSSSSYACVLYTPLEEIIKKETNDWGGR